MTDATFINVVYPPRGSILWAATQGQESRHSYALLLSLLTDVGMNSMNTPYIYKVSLFSTMKTFDPAPDKDNFCQHSLLYTNILKNFHT